MYQACPNQDCFKKVIDQQNGLYRCEKCDSEFPNFKYRMILSVSTVGSGDTVVFLESPPRARHCRDEGKNNISCGRKPADEEVLTRSYPTSTKARGLSLN